MTLAQSQAVLQTSPVRVLLHMLLRQAPLSMCCRHLTWRELDRSSSVGTAGPAVNTAWN
jgi:hypothetical protein